MAIHVVSTEIADHQAAAVVLRDPACQPSRRQIGAEAVGFRPVLVLRGITEIGILAAVSRGQACVLAQLIVETQRFVAVHIAAGVFILLRGTVGKASVVVCVRVGSAHEVG